MERKSRRSSFRQESGMTLVETVVALAILLTVAAGVMSIAVVATQTTENQGHLLARTTEYAQDKIEQLLALSFRDANSDTGSNVASCGLVTCATGGSGLGGDLAANTTVGSSDPAAAVNGYVDYLDKDGLPLGGGTTPPASWYYKRVWQITTPAGAPIALCNSVTLPTLKQITVTTTVRFGVGAGGKLVQSTLTTLKSCPF